MPLSIIFLVPGTESRNGPVNGDTIRTGGVASSGTDQSVVLVAEYLAAKGHAVTVAMDQTTPGMRVRGVTYANLATFAGVPSGARFDVLVTMLWFGAFDKIPFQVTSAVVVWNHMAMTYNASETAQYAAQKGLRLAAVFPSLWAQRAHARRHGTALLGPGVVEKVIPNPLMTDLMACTPPADVCVRVPRSFVFHSQWIRGGEVAQRTAAAVGGSAFEAQAYNEPSKACDKATLFRRLARSEYFVNPMVQPDGTLFKDTFGCSVAEALAMGVLVVTYPMGAFTEHFGDCCVFADLPPAFRDPDPHDSVVPAGALLDPGPLVEAVKRLEARGQAEKDRLRQAASRAVKARFDLAHVVGPAWESFLREMTL